MRRSIQLAALLWVAAILVVASLTTFAQRLHHPLAAWLRSEHGMTKPEALAWSTALRTSLHVPAYALLTCLLWCALPPARRRPKLVIGLVMGVAVLDEIVQAFNPHRSGSLLDLLLDLIGALLGLWVARRLCRAAPADGPSPGQTNP